MANITRCIRPLLNRIAVKRIEPPTNPRNDIIVVEIVDIDPCFQQHISDELPMNLKKGDRVLIADRGRNPVIIGEEGELEIIKDWQVLAKM